MTDLPTHATTELLRVQSQWKELQNHTKECAERKRELLEELQAHMMETGRSQMELPDGTTLELRTRKTKVPLNEKELTRILTVAFQGNHDQACKVAKFVLEERDVKESLYVHME